MGASSSLGLADGESRPLDWFESKRVSIVSVSRGLLGDCEPGTLCGLLLHREI